MKKDEVQRAYRKIMEAAGEKKWSEFKEEVIAHANPEDDYSLIEF